MQDGFEITETLLMKAKKLFERLALLLRAKIRVRKATETTLGRLVCFRRADNKKCFSIPGT